MNSARTKELALALTKVPSVTGSEGENRFAAFFRDMLAAWPYFRAHPELLRLERTIDDERERHVFIAAVRSGAAARGSGPVDAVILTGHYDVVSAADYGTLEPWAFDPEALAPRLVAELEEEERAAAARGDRLGTTEARALDDLRSGRFLPGRGLLDMKAGLAAGLALFEDFAAKALNGEASAGTGPAERRPRALVFLAVPDEEGSSHGMRSAVRALPGLLAEWGLRPLVAINLDAAVDQGEGEAGRAVFAGSVGKLHPFVLFVGRPSHAGAPFDGINPALLAAEYARRIECATDLLEGGAAEPPPPPTVLYHRDLRDRYDVTMPGAVFVSANLLSNERGPAEALAAVSRIANEAMDAALGLLRGRAEAFSRAAGTRLAIPDRRPRLLGWAEVESRARAAEPGAYAAARDRAATAQDRIAALAAFAAEAARLADIEGPAAIVGLAPPYYPRASLSGAQDGRLIALLEREIASFEKDGLGRVALRPSFPGISDMSFLYPRDDVVAARLAEEASPLGLALASVDSPSGFACPAINIGPWGREYHQRLERVNAAYAFEALPELLRRVVAALLA